MPRRRAAAPAARHAVRGLSAAPRRRAPRRRRCSRSCARDYDVILVSDEATLYDARSFAALRRPARGSPGAARDASPRPPDRASLEARMRAHVHPALRGGGARRAASALRAGARAGRARRAGAARARCAAPGERWMLGLHDAYGADDFGEPEAARRFADDTLPGLRRGDRMLGGRRGARRATARRDVVPNGSSVALGALPAIDRRGAALHGTVPLRAQPTTGMRAFLRDACPAIRARCPASRCVVLGGDEALQRSSPAIRCSRSRASKCSGIATTCRGAARDCALTINPLDGIRGSPVKLVESLAAGRACVSTADGARGFAHDRAAGAGHRGERRRHDGADRATAGDDARAASRSSDRSGAARARSMGAQRASAATRCTSASSYAHG